MSSLEQQAKEISRQNAFTIYNHMELVSVSPDRARYQLTIHSDSKNPYGIVHGGAIYALADNAAGVAVHSDGRSYVTQTGTLHFLSNQTRGTIYADATVRHRGRHTVLAVVDILGDSGKLLATGEFTFFRIEREQLAQDETNA